MSAAEWGSRKAERVFSALLRIGWTIKREKRGSHKTLSRPGWTDYVWAFHDRIELGPVILRKIAKKTGLTPGDL